MANAEHIAWTIQSISADANVGFNMTTYVGATEDKTPDLSGRRCGTVACIAGHAYLLANRSNLRRVKKADPDDIEQVAAEFLGIDADTAAHLFYDLPEGVSLDSVTPLAAVDTLTRLALTGNVQWRL